MYQKYQTVSTNYDYLQWKFNKENIDPKVKRESQSCCGMG